MLLRMIELWGLSPRGARILDMQVQPNRKGQFGERQIAYDSIG
jgi:hypothetical protein